MDGISFWTIILLFSILLVLVGVFWYFVAMAKSFFSKDAPFVGSFNYQLQLMKEKLDLEKGSSLVDLGCGDGKALRFFAKYFDLKKLDGYEIKKTAYLLGKILNRIHKQKNIRLIHNSFFEADLSTYKYIFVYLFPDQLARIENRIFTNISSDSIVISNSFEFAKHKPYKTLKNTHGKGKIFLYKKEYK